VDAVPDPKQLSETAPMPLAPPFPVCWFESFKLVHQTIPMLFMQDAARPMLGYHGKLNAETGRLRLNDGPDAIEKTYMYSAPIGVLLHEKQPGAYDLFVLEALVIGHPSRVLQDIKQSMLRFNDDGTIDNKPVKVSITIYKNVDPYAFPVNHMPPGLEMAERWMHLINEGVMGVETTSAKVYMPRVEKRNKVRPHEIRRIVRIVPKKDKGRAPPLTAGGVVDWSHRWEVRGHWRRVKGVGKDRAGDYSVVGHTWVRDFVKGPADQPLVVKTRVFQLTKEIE
jgi:hypothetical protein